MLIFVLQSIWLYISELAGKDLAISVIFKFLLYVTPTLIPLILPLTILLASIMVFGSFAENYEFAAMKSTGISLQRALRGLSVFILLLSIVTFIFANNVIPWANYNFYNLRKNIAKAQPAMAIAEGQFNQIGIYNIKVEEKSGDKGQYLKNVVIHKKSTIRTGNYTVIIAKSGELISSETSNILQLALFDGNYYDEVYNRDLKQSQKKPHVRSAFEKYTINVDLEGLNDVDFDDKSYDTRFNMLNVNDLNYTIDSLKTRYQTEYSDFSETLYGRTSITSLNNNIEKRTDSVYKGNIFELFDNKQKIQLLNLAANTVNSTNQIIDAKEKSFALNTKWLNKHVISLHEKFALGFACIILFFVGAPLGALIRKGGIGLPLIIAILLFLTYHFIGIFSKNSSQDGSFSPIIGSWLSTLIMLPLSIYLTQRATKDRGLFEFNTTLDPIKRLFRIKTKNSFFIVDEEDYSFIDNYNTEKLIDVIKNYDSYGYSKDVKKIAFSVFNNRGISKTDLIEHGLHIDDSFNQQQKIAKDFNDYSLTSYVSYIIGAILLLLFFVFRNNKLPQLASASIDLSIVALAFFIIYVIVSSIYLNKFYKAINYADKKINFPSLILGIPFYFISYYLLKNKVKEEILKSSVENIK
jgi:lipopolysaccharide export system permease protein